MATNSELKIIELKAENLPLPIRFVNGKEEKDYIIRTNKEKSGIFLNKIEQ